MAISQELWLKAKALFEQGLSLNEIELETEINRSTISKKAKTEDWVNGIIIKNGNLRPKFNNQEQQDGFLYVVSFIDTLGNIFYKIGIAKDHRSRLATHQTSIPFELKIELICYVQNMRNDEKELHQIFKEKRIRGEWFKLDKEDIIIIKKYLLKV